MKPLLSLCAIVGDAHVGLLPRMVASLVDRPRGPICDELVLGWNGKYDGPLIEALCDAGLGNNFPLVPPSDGDVPTKLSHPSGLRVVLHRQPWTGDFSQARNDNFEHASGIWRGYIDSVTGETPILVRRPGSPFIDFVEARELVPACYRERRSCTYYRTARYEVLTHEGWQIPKAVKQHRVKKPILTVVDGGLVRITEDHSLMSQGRAVAGRDLVAGDGSRQSVGTQLDHMAIQCMAVDSVPEALAEAWGFFAAEGCVWLNDSPKQYHWSLSNTEKDLLEKYRAVFEAAHTRPFYYVEDDSAVRRNSGKNVLWKLWATDGKDVALAYRDLFYTDAGRKKVPRAILNGSPRVMAAFIRGFELGDGHVARVTGDGVALQTWSLNSQILAAGLKHLYQTCGRDVSCLPVRPDKPSIVSVFERVGSWGNVSDPERNASIFAARVSGEPVEAIATRLNLDVSSVYRILRNEYSTGQAAFKTGVKAIHREDDFHGYVYDLCTDAGTFVGGVGAFVLHNSDDTIALPDTPEYKASLEADQIDDGSEVIPTSPAPASTLKEFLERQPWFVNAVLAPYHYVNSDTQRPLVRKRRPRIVRWDPWWTWVDPVHEKLEHALGRELKVYNPGLVFVHDPPLEQVERGERNYKILKVEVEKIEKAGAPLPADLLFGVGGEAYDQGDYAAAIELLDKASIADNRTDRETRLLYILYSIRARMEAGRYLEAGQRAKDAVELAPDRPEGYLAASWAAFELKLPEVCIRWYEAGGTKPVPVMAMIDDRMERCLRPVRFAAVAYQQMGRYEKAIEVCDRALKEATEAFALKVKVACEEALRRDRFVAKSREYVSTLIEAGFPGVARRVLDAVRPVVFGADSMRTMEHAVEEALAKEPQPVPDGSIVQRWFKEARPEDVVSLMPIDAAESPETLVANAVGAVQPEGGSVYLVATDTQDLTGYSREVRAEAVTAPALLDTLDQHGAVSDLLLVEDREGSGAKFVLAKAQPGKARWMQPDVTFYCPVFGESWGPWRLFREGTGGSEESVIYLAKELAARGLHVQVYAPLDRNRHRGVHVEDGVRWYPLEAFDGTREIPGITVACRAPQAVRYPAFNVERLYVWHQDSWYRQGWNAAIASAVKSLFVSKWQREQLLTSVGLVPPDRDARADKYGLVCGDAIPLSALDWPREGEMRDPYAVVYASSPIRGLERLIDLWQEILAAVPEAHLEVYYGWETLPPQVRYTREKIMRKLSQTPRARWHGRVPQLELERIMRTSGVAFYPCSFPEGFCIFGVRASAAGLAHVYSSVAALPEIQHPEWSAGGAAWEKGGKEAFLEKAIAALRASADGKLDREGYRKWAAEKTWDRVADAVIVEWKQRGLLK